MKSLILLWELSLGLCGVGLLALLVLVTARLIATHSGQARAEARREILPILIGGDGFRGQLRGLELDVATRLVTELAEITTGSEREAMLERAEALGVPAALEKRLHARSAQTRLSAVETLAMFRAWGEQTRAVLDDTNPDVRLGAALALAQREDAPAPVVFVEKLRMGTEERSMLIVSLMTELAARDPGAVAGLLFEADIPYEAKVAAVDALADGSGEYAPLLSYMAEDAAGESDLQPRLFRALGRTRHPAGRETIARGLASPEWPVRAAAAEAAGKAGMVEVSERLGELLADENWWVRFRSGEALLRLGAQGLIVLHAVGGGSDELARETAGAILAERKAA